MAVSSHSRSLSGFYLTMNSNDPSENVFTKCCHAGYRYEKYTIGSKQKWGVMCLKCKKIPIETYEKTLSINVKEDIKITEHIN